MHALVREVPVTVRVTSLYGDTAGAYYVEKPGQYYLDGDEPPGVWRGRGADELGLAGELDDEAFVALLAGLDPHTGRAARHGAHGQDGAGVRHHVLGAEVGVGPVRRR